MVVIVKTLQGPIDLCEYYHIVSVKKFSDEQWLEEEKVLYYEPFVAIVLLESRVQ